MRKVENGQIHCHNAPEAGRKRLKYLYALQW